MKVIRSSDLIVVHYKEVKVKVKPLTYVKSIEMAAYCQPEGQKYDYEKQTIFMLKNCIVDVEGLEYHDKKKFVIKKDEAGELSEETLDELISAFDNEELMTAFIWSCRKKIDKKIEGIKFSIEPMGND